MNTRIKKEETNQKLLELEKLLSGTFKLPFRLLIGESEGSKIVTWPYKDLHNFDPLNGLIGPLDESHEITKLYHADYGSAHILDYETGDKKEIKLSEFWPDIKFNPLKKHILIRYFTGTNTHFLVYDLDGNQLISKIIPGWTTSCIVIDKYIFFDCESNKKLLLDSSTYEEVAGELILNYQGVIHYHGWKDATGLKLIVSSDFVSYVHDLDNKSNPPRELRGKFMKVVCKNYGIVIIEKKEYPCLLNLITGDVKDLPPNGFQSNGEDDNHILLTIHSSKISGRVFSYNVVTAEEETIYTTWKTLRSAEFLRGRKGDKIMLVEILKKRMSNQLPTDLIKLTVDFV
jgi:hypothetical protein